MNKLFKTMTGDASASSHLDIGTDGKEDAFKTGDTATNPSTSDKVLVKDLRLMMNIGVTRQERSEKQPVVVNLELCVRPNQNWKNDSIDDVLSYVDIKDGIQSLAQMREFRLVETFAEYIAEFCLSFDECVSAFVNIEKPEVLQDVESVGICIYRSKS